MRIAIICDYYLDYVGGAQTSMRQQQKALTEAGHEVLMVTSDRRGENRVTQDGRYLGIRPVVTLPGVVLPVIANSARTRGLLESAFREHSIDAVHVQTEFGLAHAAADVAATLGLPRRASIALLTAGIVVWTVSFTMLGVFGLSTFR